MKTKQSLYEILGISRGDTLDEIKRAYRTLAKKYHPDVNKNDAAAESRFKEVQHAYDVLRDPQKRADYDQFGEAGVGDWTTGAQGKRVYQWGGGSTINADDLEELFTAFGGRGGHGAGIFDQFFGSRRSVAPTPRQGADQELRARLTFEQAVKGTIISVRLPAASGASGQTLEVRIPPGVEDGQRIRIRGQGAPGSNGGSSGDLFLLCSVETHPWFSREGSDILVEVPVRVSEASIGARIDVPTLDGMASVTLPPGTSSGAKLRLKGRGLKTQDGRQGDLLALIRIVPPREMSDEARRLFERLDRADESRPRDACGWNRKVNQ
jgi:DnaJ-class molecular chaperone